MTDRVVKLDSQKERTEKPSFDGLTVLVVAFSNEARTALSVAFDEIDQVECEFAPQKSTPKGALTIASNSPEVMFFEAGSEEQAATLLSEIRAEAEGATAHVVAVIPAPTKAGTIRLLKQGADDVLSTGLDSIDVARCLARAKGKRRVAEPAQAASGVRTIAFIHASGGAGATTLAVNTAMLLKQRLPRAEGNVCLLDFDFQFGDANLHLDLPLRSRLIDVVNTPERLDHRMLEDIMIDGPLGLRVLTAPDAPMPLDVFRPQTIDTIISLTRRHYRYIVIDMPMALTHWTETVLRRADQIILVTQVNVTALRAARRLLDTIKEENVTSAPIAILANRYGGGRDGCKVTLAQAEKALDARIGIVTASDYPLLVESLDQGVPAAMSRPASTFSRSISAALDGIVDHKVGVAPKFADISTLFNKIRR